MRDFFHGWRRKAGCVMLVMACFVSAAWTRSQRVWDIFTFTLGSRQCQFISRDGKLRWRVGTLAEGEKRSSEWLTVRPHPEYPHIQKDIRRFIGQVARWENVHAGFTECHIQHWSLVLPLTLIAAYLILWRPRTRTGTDDA